MSGFFITSTGTDIGKTWFASQLVRQLLASGSPVWACKPVISGLNSLNYRESDSAHLLAAMQKPVTQLEIDSISPWQFPDPLSPNMAAQRVERPLDENALYHWCDDRVKEHIDKTVLIEGVGGVMVPLNNHATVLDWMQHMNLPVILVTGSYVGTISHTLTAHAVLMHRKLSVKAIVISESRDSPASMQETLETLRHFLGSSINIVMAPRIIRDTMGRESIPDLTHLVR